MNEAGYFDCVIEMIGFVPEEVESDVRAFRGRNGVPRIFNLIIFSTIQPHITI